MENTWNPGPTMIHRHRGEGPSPAASRQSAHAPFDPTLFFVTLFLTGGGICMMFSASYAIGIRWQHSAFHFVWKQMVYGIIGVALMIYTSMVSLTKLRRCSPVWLVVTMIMLAVIWTPLGKAMGGAHRWLNFKIFLFQPSELAKLTLVLLLAHLLSRPRRSEHWLADPLLHSAITVALLVGMIFPQPHMSVILILIATAFCVCLLAGIPRKVYLTCGILMALLACVGWWKAKPYQKTRVRNWIHILLTGEINPRGPDYHIYQSVTALKRGGIRGVGFCEGRQKLLYLPAAHTDFIFSVIGEELGLLGALLTLSLYSVFLWRGFTIAYHASDQFCSLFAAGLTTLIGLEALIHVGVSTGRLPTTGMPLPFVSYGGSALMMTLAMVGFILNVSRNPDLQTGSADHELATGRRGDGGSRVSSSRRRRGRSIYRNGSFTRRVRR